MQITVKLFGTLRREFPDYDLSKGMEIEVKAEMQVQELLEYLNIQNKTIGMVTVDQEIVPEEKRLQEGNVICIFQPLFGG